MGLIPFLFIFLFLLAEAYVIMVEYIDDSSSVLIIDVQEGTPSVCPK